MIRSRFDLNNIIQSVKRNAILIVSMSALLFSLINVCVSATSNQKIVIFDKAAVFNDYYHYLKTLESGSKSPLTQDFLDKKNSFFIKALTIDLSNYQKIHHVIVMKRSALAAPIAYLGTKNDITKIIKAELKTQEAIS